MPLTLTPTCIAAANASEVSAFAQVVVPAEERADHLSSIVHLAIDRGDQGSHVIRLRVHSSCAPIQRRRTRPCRSGAGTPTDGCRIARHDAKIVVLWCACRPDGRRPVHDGGGLCSPVIWRASHREAGACCASSLTALAYWTE